MSLTTADDLDQTRMRRLQQSIPATYTIWNDGTDYWAETTLAGGADYGGSNDLGGADGGDFVTVLQAAIDALASSGGRIHFRPGTYMLEGATAPKPLDNITFSGEGSGTAGSIIKADATYTGGSLFDTAATTDTLVKNISFLNMRFDGNSVAGINGLNLTNLSVGYFYEVAVAGCNTGKSLIIDFDGTIPPAAADMPGGVYIDSCRFNTAGGTCIDLQYCTQVWVNNCWFVAAAFIDLSVFNCIKVHTCNNEFNVPTGANSKCFYVYDDANLDTHDVNSTGDWMQSAATGYPIYVNLTNPSATSWIRFNDTFVYAAGSKVYCNDWTAMPHCTIYGASGARTFATGTSTGTGGQQTIAHTLATTPNRVWFTNIEDGANPYQWQAADATNIYVQAVLNQDYAWKAEIV